MKFTKSTLLIVILTCSLFMFSSCQENQRDSEQKQSITKTPPTAKEPEKTKLPAKAQPETGQPLIEVKNPVHNFGKIAPIQKYTCTFEFKNVGDATLKIKKIQTTCGCTVTNLKKMIYAPGESGEIKVTYSSPKKEGDVAKNLYIKSDAKNDPKLKLTIKGEVYSKIDCQPQIMNLALRAENAGLKPITIKSKDDIPFSVTSFSASKNAVKAKYDTELAATEIVLNLSPDREKLKKIKQGTVKIGLTHPDCKEVTVSFTVKPPFEVSRPRIIIQNAKPGEPVTREVWVTSNYSDHLEIESITSTKNYMEVIEREQKDNSVKLMVQVTPPPQTGKKRYFSDDLQIKVKDGDVLTVLCSGWFKKQTP